MSSRFSHAHSLECGAEKQAAWIPQGTVLGLDEGREAKTTLRQKSQAMKNLDVDGPLKPLEFSHLTQLVEKQFIDGKYRYLIRDVISKPQVLLTAFTSLKANLGHSTETDADFLGGAASVGVSFKWFHETGGKLREGTYEFEPIWKFEGLKLGRTDRRPVTIANTRDKIVQEAFRMTLDIIYEPRFKDMSHGFRNNRGIHTALRDVKMRWKHPSWWLEFNIQKSFDTGNRKLLLSTLGETIQDSRFEGLLNQMCNARILDIELGGLGFPQGSILSPILSNVYLDKLDSEILRMREELEKGSPRHRRLNPQFKRLLDMPKSSVKKMGPDALLREKRRRLKIMRRESIPFLDPSDPEFVRIYACRYAEDVLMAVSGPKCLARNILERVSCFLKDVLFLEINPEKTRLIHVEKDKATFLGMTLLAPKSMQLQVRSDKAIRAKKKYLGRIRRAAVELSNGWEKGLKKLGEKLLVSALKKALKDGGQPDNLTLVKPDQKVRRMLEQLCREVVSDVQRPTKMARDVTVRLAQEMTKGDILMNSVDRDGQEVARKFDELVILIDKLLHPEFEGKPKQSTNGERDSKNASMDELQAYRIQIYAPLARMLEKFRTTGIINADGKPVSIPVLTTQDDLTITQWYGSVAHALLSYYRCCDNFYKVKKLVDYQLRWSCLNTLSHKTKAKGVGKVIDMYTQELRVETTKGTRIYFPTPTELRFMGKQFLVDRIRNPERLLGFMLLRTTTGRLPVGRCSVVGCRESKIDKHNIRALERSEVDGSSSSIVNSSSDRLSGLEALHVALNRKMIFLCRKHQMAMHAGYISLHDIETSMLLNPKQI